MNFKMYALLFLFVVSDSSARCNASELLRVGSKMPQALKKCPGFPTFWWNGGSTSLHQAVFDNDIETARKLLERGVETNPRNAHGETPLFHATQYRQAEMVALLLRYSAEPLARDNNGGTPLNRLMQYSPEEPQKNAPVIQAFLAALGFGAHNTCENRHYALSASNHTIRLFQKSNGTIATYIPTLYGSDGFGNHRIQTLVEDNIYPNTIKVVLDWEWDHEGGHVQGYAAFDDFSLSENFLVETSVKIEDLPCPWKKWEEFLAIRPVPGPSQSSP